MTVPSSSALTSPHSHPITILYSPLTNSHKSSVSSLDSFPLQYPSNHSLSSEKPANGHAPLTDSLFQLHRSARSPFVLCSSLLALAILTLLCHFLPRRCLPSRVIPHPTEVSLTLCLPPASLRHSKSCSNSPCHHSSSFPVPLTALSYSLPHRFGLSFSPR